MSLFLLALVFFLIVTIAIRNVKHSRSSKLLDQQLQKLNMLNQSKNQLFSIVSHDLRSAIYSLQINISMLKTLLSPLMMKNAISIIENLEQITISTHSLLNNLLYWSLSQTGQISYQAEKIQLQPLINGVCFDFLPVAASKNIVLHYTTPGDLSCTGDINSIKVILRNLIDNAIKYTPAKGSVTIAAEEGSDHCRITVQDTGIGMEQELINTLFTGDNRRIQKDASGRQSTGIGLWLAREMTAKNKGTLSISSKKGTGTLVTLLFPKQS